MRRFYKYTLCILEQLSTHKSALAPRAAKGCPRQLTEQVRQRLNADFDLTGIDLLVGLFPHLSTRRALQIRPDGWTKADYLG
jgi:hypothetical protein